MYLLIHQHSFFHQIYIELVGCVRQHTRIRGKTGWIPNVNVDRYTNPQKNKMGGHVQDGRSFRSWLLPVAGLWHLLCLLRSLQTHPDNVVLLTLEVIYISPCSLCSFIFSCV